MDARAWQTCSGQTSPLPIHWIGVDQSPNLKGTPIPKRLVCVPPATLRTHALVIGSTGSGKTNLLLHLVAQDILLGHSFCVLDMRGDLISAVLELCAGNVPEDLVRVIDLRERTQPTGFNPLFGSGEPYFRALQVLEAVANEAPSWGIQLEETLRNALLLLAEVQEPLTKLEHLFFDVAFLRSCIGRCDRGSSVLAFWQRFDRLPEERRIGLASPVLNKVSALLSTTTLRRVLGHSKPMDLGGHINTPGSITLVSLAVDELHAAGRMLGRLVLASICREVFARVAVPEKQRNPIRLYVDEFENFGTEQFEQVLAEGRRFACSVILAHQTLAQLPARARSMILNNVGTKFVFRCGREDAASLSADLVGDRTALALSTLPVGQAVFWERSGRLRVVEVNQPLLPDIGALSARARAFRDKVLILGADVPPPTQFQEPMNSQCPEVCELDEDSREVFQKLDRALEDWLCD